jgi:hypothetical protein
VSSSGGQKRQSSVQSNCLRDCSSRLSLERFDGVTRSFVGVVGSSDDCLGDNIEICGTRFMFHTMDDDTGMGRIGGSLGTTEQLACLLAAARMLNSAEATLAKVAKALALALAKAKAKAMSFVLDGKACLFCMWKDFVVMLCCRSTGLWAETKRLFDETFVVMSSTTT